MFVGGLLPSFTKKDLFNYFSQFGEIEKGIIMTDKLTGKSRGFGFIIFNEKETIDKIMKKGNCHILNGKLIECKRSKPKIQSMNILHEKEYFHKLNNNNNIIFSNHNIKKNNNEIIINYSLKSLGKLLVGNKTKYGANLFTYQNYIPKNEITCFTKVNLQSNKKIKYFNKNYMINNNNPNLESHTNLKNESEKENKNEGKKTNNINNQFQDYFNNQLKNPSSCNFIHFKLYDSNGEEVSKLSNYKRNNLKIKLFPEELDDKFEKNKIKLNNKEEKNNKNDNFEFMDEFGPDRSSCRKGKTRSSLFNNESYKPY